MGDSLFTSFQDAQHLKVSADIVTLEYHQIADLILTSGNVLACDLYACSEHHPFIAEAISPGEYPVLLAIAHFENTDQRVAFAAVQISKSFPVKWVPATSTEKTALNGNEFIYGVDSGIGSFMDVEVVSDLLEMLDEREKAELIEDEFAKTYTPTWAWANILVKQETGGNVLVWMGRRSLCVIFRL